MGMKKIFISAVMVIVMIAFSLPDFAMAGQERGERRTQQRDQDKALGARQKAKLLPYGGIKKSVQREFNGRVVGQNLVEMRAGEWAYVLKLLQKNGEVRTIIVNAHNGKIISRGGR